MTDEAYRECLACGCYMPVAPRNPRGGGTCRRRPPRPILVGVDRMQQPRTLTFYPVTGPGDGCWESKPPLTAAAPLRLRTGPSSPVPANGSAARKVDEEVEG